MTDQERKSLQPGHVVRVRGDDGKDFIATVKYGVWQLGHGAWVVGLVGRSGGYDLNRVIDYAFEGEVV